MIRLFATGPDRGLAVVGIVLAASVGIAALGSAIGWPSLPGPLAELDQRLPGIFRMHMMASGLGLIVLPSILLLRRRPSVHRVLGRIGAGLLFVGTATALPSALLSESTPVARLGFFVQGVLCLVFLVGGVKAIRAREVRRHAQMMARLSALVFGVIVLRVALAMAASLGWPFEPTYAALAWLSWAVPLAIVVLWPIPISQSFRMLRWMAAAAHHASASRVTPAVAMTSSMPGKSHIHQASRR
jgi:uncharacterized membrane protein